MLDKNSRYYVLETASYITSYGQTISYKRRRFLPEGNSLPLLTETKVEQSERLDLISHRTIGDSEQFWRICDANNAMLPFDLVDEPGSWLKVPMPQQEEPR
jgi:hypothetical protein